MLTTEVHAPTLSTPQDSDVFTYAKVNKTELKRVHLNLQPGEDYVQKLHEYYSLKELAEFLGRCDETGRRVHQKVTLQFPDSLICDSASVVQELQRMLKTSTLENVNSNLAILETDLANMQTDLTGLECQNKCESHCLLKIDSLTRSLGRLWILADTSYSPCCIDEVAAEHVGADLVVHFGDACLNPVASINSAYVFGKPQLHLKEAVEHFRDRYPDPNEQTVVLMADAPHTHLLGALADALPEYKLMIADLHLQENVTCLGYRPTERKGFVTLGRVFASEVELLALDLFHVTVPEPPRLLQLVTQFQSVSTYENGKVSQGPFPNLMRRYRFMHMARSAGTIGILVNTLSLANTKKVISELSKKIKEAGKKHYLFVVGKPNVAKLANFEAVDLWCVLGCDHQGILLDQANEYYKPIVTPYELLLAIGDEFSWTGKWVTDFDSVLSLTEETEGEDEQEGDEEKKEARESDSDEEPEFDPVSGKYVNARPLRRINHLQITLDPAQDGEESQALVKKLLGAVALRNTVSTSAAHLQTREWTGLGSDWGEAQLSHEGAEVEEGDAGIARGYTFDRQQK